MAEFLLRLDLIVHYGPAFIAGMLSGGALVVLGWGKEGE